MVESQVFPVGYVLTDHTNVQVSIVGQASGGQGLVVWGPDTAKGGEWTALKMVRPDRASEIARRAFEQEALVWCHLWAHPYIIHANSILLLRDLNDLPVLILEYASGGSLRQVLTQAHQPGMRIGLRTALNWAQQIVAALEAMHTPDLNHERPEPLIHCDIKPENVLLEKQDAVKVTDLGLAKAYAQGQIMPVAASTHTETGGKSNLTGAIDPHQLTHSTRYVPDATIPEMGRRGAVQGTLPYMPPEQWQGVDAVVPASDIYAFGVLLFELFAGTDGYPHQPAIYNLKGWYDAHWNGPSRHLVEAEVQAVLDGPLSELAEQRGRNAAWQMADQLDKIIADCLRRNPQDRPTAAQVRQRLGEIAVACGLSPMEIPEPFPHTLYNETVFWNNLALVYSNIGQLEESLRLHEKARDLFPDDPNGWYMTGVAMSQLGYHVEALMMWEEAEQRLTPEWLRHLPHLDAAIAYGVAVENGKMKLYRDSVKAGRRAVQLNPNYGEAWSGLVITLFNWAMTTSGEECRQLLLEAQEANIHALHLMPNNQGSQDLAARLAAALQELGG